MSPEFGSVTRSRVLQQRKALSVEQISRLSGEVVSRFLKSEEFQSLKAKRGLYVGVYRALSSELDLSSLFQVLQNQDWKICFPRIVDQTHKTMEFVEVPQNSALGELWRKGPHGTFEPHAGLHPIDPGRLSLIFVPGVAFGENGERVGMGAGYYDRYLPRLTALRVALAFDFQVFPSLPQEQHDQPVHWIVTEKKDIKTSHWQTAIEHWRKFHVE